MSNPEMKYELEIHETDPQARKADGSSLLAKWVSNSPFGSIAVGDTLNPRKWENGLTRCMFRVVSVEHTISQIGSGVETETWHSIWLNCTRASEDMVLDEEGIM